MSGVNKVIIVGRVGQDPEVRHLENGVVANFSMATSETWKDKSGEKKEATEWHRVVIWGKLAEVVEKYVKKGDMLYIEGKIVTRSYEKNNQTMYTTEIVANSMQMLGSKQQGQITGNNNPEQAPIQDDNDLPF